MFLMNCNKKENDLNVLVRDQFDSVSETEESLSSPSPVETNSNPINIPGQSENHSRDEIIIRASSLVHFWEAKSQQSSWSRSHSLIDSRTSSGISVLDYFFSESLNDRDETDWCDKSYVSDSCEKTREARLVRIRGRQLIEDISAMIIRDRKKYLKWIASCCAVSKFSPRGSERLKYMLRIHNFERCLAIRDKYKLKSAARSSRRLNNSNRHKKNVGKVNSLVDTKISSRMVSSSTVSLDKGETVEKAIVMESVEMYKSSLSIAEKVILWETTNGRKSMKKTARRVVDAKSTEINNEIAKKGELCSFEESSLMEFEEHTINPQDITTVIDLDIEDEGETMTYVDDDDDEETPKSEKPEEEEALRLIFGSPKFINGWDENVVEDEDEGEEEEDYSEENVEYNDWFIVISRPRIHWETLRETRRLEIMNKHSENDVISNMMNRRIVYSLLANGFREKMDKILMSRLKMRFPIEDEEEEEEEDRLVECSPSYQENFEESTKSTTTMMCSLENHEAMTTLSSNPIMDHENTSYEPHMLCYQKEHRINPQEITTVVDLVKSCLDLQKFADIESVSVSDSQKKNCSVCIEMPIESSLYRCGHTCTCLE